MDVRLLGAVEAVGQDGSVDLGGSRPTRVLLALVIAEGHRLTLDALVERCFDEADRPDDPIPALRTAIRRLRRALGDETIETRQGGYELIVDRLELDLPAFDAHVTAGRATDDPVAAQTSFRRALDLWRGTPFGDHSDLDWAMPERVRLEEQHLVALEGWHDAHLRNGSVTEIIPSLEATAARASRCASASTASSCMRSTWPTASPRRCGSIQDFLCTQIDRRPGSNRAPETVELERAHRDRRPDRCGPTPQPRTLRGYAIEERLGEGAFSIVYLGNGSRRSIGRWPIKQIRAELANQPGVHPPLRDRGPPRGPARTPVTSFRSTTTGASPALPTWSCGTCGAAISRPGSTTDRWRSRQDPHDGPTGRRCAGNRAHRSGVVHRDVKPENILLDEDDNAYLADFGIALEAAEAADPHAAALVDGLARLRVPRAAATTSRGTAGRRARARRSPPMRR